MPDATLDKLESWQAAIIAYGDGPVVPPTGGLPRHRMGVHLIGNREPDFAYMQALGVETVKIVDPDPTVVRRVLSIIGPNGICILRDHPLSEQKSDMARDPIGTGLRHALDWREKLTSGRFAEFGRDRRIVVCGINEPDVHNAAEEQSVFAYTKAFLETLTANNIRALALNLSVGWPRNGGADTPPIWDSFLPLEKTINDGNHFLCTHEYWYPNPQDKWGWYGNRIAKCPMTVPIIIGECAYTRQLANLPQPWGWQGNMSPQAYAEQLWWCHDNVDVNVRAILPFTTGFASQDWASKDTQPAHADILARVRTYSFPAVWPVNKGELPVIPPTTSDKDLLIYPKYTGKVTGYYGSLYKNSAGAAYAHEGLDISTATGTPIYAPYDGVVAWADPAQAESSPYGIYCRTYHPELNVCFFFGHLSECVVKTGNSVKQGQMLGYSGNTGNSTGPHLHFEVRLMTAAGGYQTGVSANGNARVDPLAFAEAWKRAGKKVEER